MSVTIDGLSFDYRKPIGNTGARPSGALTDYPLLVRIVGDTDIGGRCLSTGNDLRFCLDDDTLLYAEKDSFAVAGGAATGAFWVNVPSVPSGADIALRCYYGNAGASAQASPESAYNSNYKLVAHLGEASGTLYDATANNNDGTVNAGATYDSTGKVGKCITWRGNNNDYASFGNGASLNITGYITLSAWVYPTSYTNDYNIPGIIAKSGSTANETGYEMRLDYDKLRFMIGTGPGWHWAVSSAAVGLNAWTHVAGVWDGSYLRTYINGAANGTPVSQATGPATNTFAVMLADGYQYADWRNFKGLIDEPRVVAAALAAAWIAYDHASQGAGVLTWGAEEAAGASAFRLFSFRKRGDSLAKGR